jgi:Flp pilus assembly protein TadB
MIHLSIALALLAAAVPLWSAAGVAKARLAEVSRTPAPKQAQRSKRLLPVLLTLSIGTLTGVLAGWPQGIPIGAVTATVAWLSVRRILRPTREEPNHLGLAASWDLLAACLRAGLPVPTAVLAIAADLPAQARTALRGTADLLALGADPVSAWAPALDCPTTAGLARGARRTARSGAALAGVAETLATTIREAANDAAEAKAQRAGVLITGPLGLCFLPAFVCLGIVPVVVGLATQLSIHQ